MYLLAAEENVVHDCMGSGQVVAFAGSQRMVITRFLFANDKALIRVFHPASPLWDVALTRAEAGTYARACAPGLVVVETV